MKNEWLWIGKYLIVIAAALLLGTVLGGLEPFRSATLGNARISAGNLAQFIAHTGALGLLWALGYRLAEQLRASPGSIAHVASAVLALTTLIVTASAYGVLLQFTTPWLSQVVKSMLDWVFIVGILAAAGWLLWALFNDSEAVIEAVGKAVRKSEEDGRTA